MPERSNPENLEDENQVQRTAPLNVQDTTLEPVKEYNKTKAIEESEKLATSIINKIIRSRNEGGNENIDPTPITNIQEQSLLIRSLKKMAEGMEDLKIEVSFTGTFNGIVDHVTSSGLDESKKKEILTEFMTDVAQADTINFDSLESAQQFLQAANKNGVEIEEGKINVNELSLNDAQQQAEEAAAAELGEELGEETEENKEELNPDPLGQLAGKPQNMNDDRRKEVAERRPVDAPEKKTGLDRNLTI